MQNIVDPKAMWIDIVKFITVAVIIHLLFYCVDDYGSFFNESILKILLYATIGFIVYHLVITKLVDKYLFPKYPIEKLANLENPTNLENLENPEKTKKSLRSIIRKSTSKRKNKRVSFKN